VVLKNKAGSAGIINASQKVTVEVLQTNETVVSKWLFYYTSVSK